MSDAKLWEMRFQAAEKSREAYRESSRQLVQENELLQSAISQVLPMTYHLAHLTSLPPPCPLTLTSQTEKDTVKVIGFLKKEGGRKDEEVGSLRGELCQVQETAASEKRELDQQYKTTVEELEIQLQDRTEEVNREKGSIIAACTLSTCTNACLYSVY